MAETIDPKAYVERAAELMGLTIEAEAKGRVIANFANYLALYEQIRSFTPGQEAEPLAVYRPEVAGPKGRGTASEPLP